MDFRRRFEINRQGSTIPSIAWMVGAVAIAALAGAYSLGRSSRDGSLSASIAKIEPELAARFGNATASLPRPDGPAKTAMNQVTLDYMPTGSIPNSLAQPVILNPCSAAQK